jgi:hypothetical protein
MNVSKCSVKSKWIHTNNNSKDFESPFWNQSIWQFAGTSALTRGSDLRSKVHQNKRLFRLSGCNGFGSRPWKHVQVIVISTFQNSGLETLRASPSQLSPPPPIWPSIWPSICYYYSCWAVTCFGWLQLPVLVPLELELDLILEPVGNPEFIILKNQTWNWIHGFIYV